MSLDKDVISVQKVHSAYTKTIQMVVQGVSVSEEQQIALNLTLH